MSDYSLNQLKAIAAELRYLTVKMSLDGKAPHLGSGLSCLDILTAAYFGGLVIDPVNPDAIGRDRFILSKGHAVAALYATLSKRGYFGKEMLLTFNQENSCLPEHPTPKCIAGIEAATGSLGHGLSIGLGMAHAAQLKGLDYRVCVLLSDGECNEGSVWEAAMYAPAKKLNNMIAIVDYNKWQATGRSDEVLAISSLSAKWKAFGWETYEVDGHDLEALMGLIKNGGKGDKPTAIVAHTVKGKGVSFMEDDNNWHYRIPTVDELAKAKQELGLS